MEESKQLLAELLLRWEGEFLTPYRCPAGIPTIGVGATTYPDGRKVTMKDLPITQEISREMLRIECEVDLRKVEEMLTREATKYQMVAFASLAYNVGINAFKKSTVLRAHNEGDTAAASRAFSLWNKARVNGKLTVLRGLVARRADEAAMYLREEPSPFREAPAQAVAEESPLVKSPINMAGATGVAAGGATLATELLGGAAPLVTQAKDIAMILNINPSVLFGLVVLGSGAVAMYYRHIQRTQGWA